MTRGQRYTFFPHLLGIHVNGHCSLVYGIEPISRLSLALVERALTWQTRLLFIAIHLWITPVAVSFPLNDVIC